MSKLGKLEKVNLRDIWKNEEYDFSSWLSRQENLKELSSVIGVDIVLEERESSVGKYSVDIYGYEEGSDRKIVIENQLEDTDHDHLGKIITYASGKDAKTVVWIVKRARDEHRLAIEWLNSHTDEDIGFFLLEIELWKIGDSQPAPKFNIVSQPNEWGKNIKSNVNYTKAQNIQFDFWTGFVESSRNYEKFSKEFNIRKAQPQHWHDLSVGSSEYHLCLTCATQRNEIGVEIYIDNNKNIYDLFYENKSKIESSTNCKFIWQRLENKKASRIKIIKKVDLTEVEKWEEYYLWLFDISIIMKKEFNLVYNKNK